MSDEPSPFALAAPGQFAPDPHRLLPASVDAEKGVLSSMLLAPAEVCFLCQEKGCAADWFHVPIHAIIYGAIIGLWDASRAIDFVTLTQHLHDANRLQEAGGPAYITDIFTFLPTAANAEYYLEILAEKRISREIIRCGTEHASRGYTEQNEPNELLDSFERRVLAIRGDRSQAKIKTAHQAVKEAMAGIEHVLAHRGQITGIPTGFHDYDALLDGLHPSQLTIIAARPSQGKTAFAMNMADFIAVELRKPVAVFTIEMTTEQLMQRMIYSRARVNWIRLRDEGGTQRDFQAMADASSALSDSPLFFDDSSDITIQELRGRARRLKAREDIQVIFVDYLQLVKSGNKRAQENRQIEVADVSAGLKAMAKELKIPVVALAQISRGVETRGPNAKPRLSDLKESGAIEQDADNVVFLNRPETAAETQEEKDELRGLAYLTIPKQRNGPNGDIALTFLKEYTRFETRAFGDDSQPQLI